MPAKKKQKSQAIQSENAEDFFGISNYECAPPDCTQPIIQSATAYSEAAVIGHIAHIHAASDKGPRGKPGLSDMEKNHPDNLLLFCPSYLLVFPFLLRREGTFAFPVFEPVWLALTVFAPVHRLSQGWHCLGV